MKRTLILASVASMIDQFNMPNIRLMKEMGYEVDVAANFVEGSTCSDEKIAALKMTLAKLDSLSSTDEGKIKILEQSIFNSWKGVFAIDNRRSDQQRSRVSGTAGTGSGGNKGSGRRLPPVEKSLLEDFGS